MFKKDLIFSNRNDRAEKIINFSEEYLKNSTHNFSIEDTIIEERRELIESEIFETIPHLKNIVSYKRYFVSNKTKYDYETDDRSIRIFNKDRYYSFSGGKISGIFEMEPILDSLVQ